MVKKNMGKNNPFYLDIGYFTRSYRPPRFTRCICWPRNVDTATSWRCFQCPKQAIEKETGCRNPAQRLVTPGLPKPGVAWVWRTSWRISNKYQKAFIPASLNHTICLSNLVYQISVGLHSGSM